MIDHPTPIVITVGEPAGVGPDLVIKLAHTNPFKHPLVVLCDENLLEQRAKTLGLAVSLEQYRPNTKAKLSLLSSPLPKRVKPGQPDPRNNLSLLNSLNRAVQGCLQGEFSALVTGPLNKASLQITEPSFCGHTEYLAKQCQVEKSLMLFVYEQLRVALLTTHIPLRTVAQQVTEQNLMTSLKLLHQGLQQHFQVKQPMIMVTGLNPHAGEQGGIGSEEQEIIEPTLDKLRAQGWQLQGPVAADTVFHRLKRSPADAILSLYHDQSLPVLKTLALGKLVNVTLGLPFIRTSVDHGTAFDVAGTNQADESGLLSAIELAIHLVKNHATSST